MPSRSRGAAVGGSSALYFPPSARTLVPAHERVRRKDLPDDGWREYQLLRHAAEPSHPFHRFSIGSIDTLNTTTIATDLHAYFHAQYSANRMRLVLVDGAGQES